MQFQVRLFCDDDIRRGWRLGAALRPSLPVRESRRPTEARPWRYELNDTDAARIKAQFVALGLIKTLVSQTTAGGYAEFLSLTSREREISMDNIVVQKLLSE